MANKILTQSQAEAVYSAMCALNNVCGRLECKINERVNVRESVIGLIWLTASGEKTEMYEHQSAFAAAYDLQ